MLFVFSFTSSNNTDKRILMVVSFLFLFSKCSTVAGFFRSGCWRGTIAFKPVKALLEWWRQSYFYMSKMSQYILDIAYGYAYISIHLYQTRVQTKIMALQMWAGSNHSTHSVQYKPRKTLCQDSAWFKIFLKKIKL